MELVTSVPVDNMRIAVFVGALSGALQRAEKKKKKIHRKKIGNLCQICAEPGVVALSPIDSLCLRGRCAIRLLHADKLRGRHWPSEARASVRELCVD
jgi:hypothetical protein